MASGLSQNGSGLGGEQSRVCGADQCREDPGGGAADHEESAGDQEEGFVYSAICVGLSGEDVLSTGNIGCRFCMHM